MKLNRVTALLLILILLLPGILTGCQPGGGPDKPSVPSAPEGDRVLGVPVLTEEALAALKEAREEAYPEVFAGALTYDGTPIPSAGGGATYYLTVDADLAEGWGTGTLSAKEGVSLALRKEDTDVTLPLLMKKGQPCRVLLYTDEHYAEVDLILTSLPILIFNTDEEIGETDTAASVSMFNPRRGDIPAKTVSSAAMMRIRGATSRLLLKKPYKMELYKDDFSDTNSVKLLSDLRKDDDWVLNPVYSEEAKIREAVCWDIWKAICSYDKEGADGAVDVRYVEVIHNDAYFGLYLLMERFDEKQLNLETGDGLIKAKTDRPSAAQVRQMGAFDETCVGVEKEFPNPQDGVVDNTWTTFADYLDYSYEQVGTLFARNIDKYADRTNMLEYWLHLQVTGGWDNTWKNCYYATIDGKVYVFPWDMDLTFGMGWYGYRENFLFQDPSTLNVSYDFQTGRRLLKYCPGAVNQLKEMYQALKESGTLTYDAIVEIGKGYWDLIHDSGAYARDAEVWPRGNHVDDLGYFSYAVSERLRFVDEYINSLVDVGDAS